MPITVSNVPMQEGKRRVHGHRTRKTADNTGNKIMRRGTSVVYYNGRERHHFDERDRDTNTTLKHRKDRAKSNREGVADY
jgi:hypothetical protein